MLLLIIWYTMTCTIQSRYLSWILFDLLSYYKFHGLVDRSKLVLTLEISHFWQSRVHCDTWDIVEDVRKSQTLSVTVKEGGISNCNSWNFHMVASYKVKVVSRQTYILTSLGSLHEYYDYDLALAYSSCSSTSIPPLCPIDLESATSIYYVSIWNDIGCISELHLLSLSKPTKSRTWSFCALLVNYCYFFLDELYVF